MTMTTAVQIFTPAPARPEVVNVRLATDELELLDQEAARLGVTRSDLVRVAIGQLMASRER